MSAANRLTAITYALGALMTFGHAADTHSRDAWARYSACLTIEANTDRVMDCQAPSMVEAPFAATIAGIFWPLYTSWVITEQLRDGSLIETLRADRRS